MILSESEKNRIKGLYGIITEAETAPPPDERELVVKDKNPFKYTEYEDARRKYSPDLKDGDRFYQMKNNEEKTFLHSSYWGSDFGKGLYYNTFKDIFKPLVGKTIRNNKTDEIYKIDPFHLKYDRFTKDWVVETDLNELFELIIPNNSEAYLYKNTPNSMGGYTKIELNDEDKEIYGKFINYVRSLLKDFVNQINSYKDEKNISTIPDEYFDIFKVKRRQTDF